MDINDLKGRRFENEFTFSTSRSSGPGGQNVNKVNSQVELRFNIHTSNVLCDSEKSKLLNLASHYLTNLGELVFVSQKYRSQSRNKEDAIERFYQFLVKELRIKKKRKASIRTKSSIEKRLKKKRNLSEIKQRRRKPDL